MSPLGMAGPVCSTVQQLGLNCSCSDWLPDTCSHSLKMPHPHSINITTSCYPVPSICCHDLVYDWFESLAECLHWNVRKKQAQLIDVMDDSDTEN